MGNRAIITTPKRDMGVYLHWNGGRDSVEPLLHYCKLRGFRNPMRDSYGYARMVQVMANFLGGDGLSVGISPYTTDRDMDPGDNGIYFVDDWEIVDRYPKDAYEQQTYPFEEMLLEIDAAQPADQQLREVLLAKDAPRESLSIGDMVWFDSRFFSSDPSHERRGNFVKAKVVGFGEGVVNGYDFTGVPYVDLYSMDDPEGFASNSNNYIRTSEVLLASKED